MISRSVRMGNDKICCACGETLFADRPLPLGYLRVENGVRRWVVSPLEATIFEDFCEPMNMDFSILPKGTEHIAIWPREDIISTFYTLREG